MDVVTIDFETYYDRDFTLSKMSTEAYVRDDRFKVHGCGVKINDGPARWYAAEELDLVLPALNLPTCACLAHHAQFDGFILNERYGISPKFWLDTLSMGRAIVGVEVGGSLAKLATHFQLGEKGTEVENTLGKLHLTDDEMRRLGAYCINDVELTYALLNKLMVGFPKSELRLIDRIIRLYTEPILKLDFTLLKDSLEEIQAHKMALLLDCGASQKDLMSNEKFAALLTQRGVVPPKKISERTGKETWAFAKTDPRMQALLEHPDEEVQMLVAARLGVKSTIAETRTQAFMNMATRGPAPVYLKYSGAAQTHRLSGGDKVNWQNLGRGSKLRDAVVAPKGFKLVVVDSSNIESRVLDYLAGEQEALAAYREYDAGRGPDIYCYMASKIYGRKIIKEEHPDERFLGKVAKLGLGYGMGKDKFYATVTQWKVPNVNQSMANDAVALYRASHARVVQLWARADTAISYIANGNDVCNVDVHGILQTEKGAILLPNGLKIRYPELRYDAGGWMFRAGRETVKLYGGKCIENCVQALARIIVMDQTMELAKRWRLVLSVHDEAVFCVPEDKADECLADALRVFRIPPKWAPDLPMNAEGDTAYRYGEAK